MRNDLELLHYGRWRRFFVSIRTKRAQGLISEETAKDCHARNRAWFEAEKAKQKERSKHSIIPKLLEKGNLRRVLLIRDCAQVLADILRIPCDDEGLMLKRS